MKMQDWVQETIPADARVMHRLNLQFEIALHLESLRQNPNDLHALSSLGLAYTQAGDNKKALAVDLKLVELAPEDGTSHYNLACSYALLKQPDQALQALQLAVDNGYTDFLFMQEDKDLQSLHKSKKFQSILQILEKRGATEQNGSKEQESSEDSAI